MLMATGEAFTIIMNLLWALFFCLIFIFLIFALCNIYKNKIKWMSFFTDERNLLLTFWIIGFAIFILVFLIEETSFITGFTFIGGSNLSMGVSFWIITIFGAIGELSIFGILVCSIWICVIWSKGGKRNFLEKRNLKKKQHGDKTKIKNKDANNKGGII